MRLLFIALSITFTIPGFTQQKEFFNPTTNYHPDTLKRWTHNIFTELSKKHPGFYRYTPKATFDLLIDSTLQTITDSLTTLEFYKKVKPLIARIGCLHTSVALSKEYSDYLNAQPTLFPFEVFVTEDNRLFITKNHSENKDISLRAEILSINNVPVDDIVHTLYLSIPSDGYNHTVKTLVLNHQFSLWYQTIIGPYEHFTIDIAVENKRETFIVKGINKEVFPTMESLESSTKKQLDFKIEDNTGILTIHSFAKSVIKKNNQNFKKFIKSTFKELQQRQITTLLIDLRYNTGGTDGNAAFLASHFFDNDFKYWDKIEVTEGIAKEIKGVYRLFYKKPKKVDTAYHWRKTWVTNEFNYFETQKPAKNNFKGKTYILTNGLCMSSCADFVAVLSHNKKALVIGQETGGGYQGNTSGMMPKTTLPNGLVFTVPLMKYTTAVDPRKNFGHGTAPDHVITYTLNDWISKKDREMEFAKQLLHH